MLLAADVGNTNVKLGIFDGDNLKFKLRFSTDENKTSDELAVELFTFLQIYNIDAKNIDGAIISSVVPKFTYNLRSAIMTVTGKKSLLIGPGLKTGLDIKIEHPKPWVQISLPAVWEHVKIRRSSHYDFYGNCNRNCLC